MGRVYKKARVQEINIIYKKMVYMIPLAKSEIIENVLKNLIKISGRKTSKGYAINTIYSVMERLTDKYDFLRYVKINDNRFIEDGDVVSVMKEINDADPNLMGKALNDIISNMHLSLGDNAGYFFIKELQRNIGGDYNSVMKDMGIDLGLMQLEKEINELGKTISKRK